MKQTRSNITKLSYILLSGFLALILYIGLYSMIKGPELASHPYNRRLAAYEAKVQRGTIYDQGGVVLASGNLTERQYPQGMNTAHVIGFVSGNYGRTGLESAYDRELLSMTDEGKITALLDRMMGRPRRGNDIVLTLDAELQRLAYQKLNGRKGAVVVLDPRTGAVLALTSSPSYDPNGLEKIVENNGSDTKRKYDLLLQDKDSPLLNRATQGAYPPGSVFKIITAAGWLKENNRPKELLNCTGKLEIAGTLPISDIAVHGEVDLTKALAVSCNTYFAQRAMEMGPDPLLSAVKSFGVTSDPGLNLQYRPGTIDLEGKGEDNPVRLLASTAIGQGYLQVSPLSMALAASAIANEGRIMRPQLLREIKNYDGNLVRRELPGVWLSPVTPEIASVIREGMVAAVESGTARAAALGGVQVAGKTGSAENPHGAEHAWFVGFAPADKPRVVVAVLVENGGSGGGVAAPLARDILAAALDRH